MSRHYHYDYMVGDYMAILLAFLTGGCVIISILLNGKITREVGLKQAGLLNYITGISVSLVLYLIFSRQPLLDLPKLPFYYYLGGWIGVFVVLSGSKIVNHLSAVYTTVLVFFGQMMTAIIIDFFISGNLDLGKLIGSTVMVIGLVLNAYFDNKELKEAQAS